MLLSFVVLLILSISSAVSASETHHISKRQTSNLNQVGGQGNSAVSQLNPGAGQNNPITGQVNPGAGQNNPITGQANPGTGQSNTVSVQVNPGQINPVQNPPVPTNNPSTNNVVQTNDKRILAKLIGDFGLEMSDMIHQNGEQDTVVFSPLSIATLMTLLMAGMGQQSNSYFETLMLLGYDKACSPNPCDETVIHQLYKDLLSDLTTQNNHVTFSMGNRLYLQSESSDKQNGLNIFGSYTKIAKEYYKAGTETLDFFNDPFGAANRINKWVSTATEGKIPQLLTDPLSPQTKFMAVNTVYFKAPWLKPFVTDGTIVKKFDTGKGKIDMSFMTQIMGLKGDKIDELQATVIELPYKGERYSMFIMKPEGPASLNSVLQMETALTPENINILIDRVKAKQPLPVSVQIPRMRLRYRAYLKEIIGNLGATSMFSVVNADFSRLTSSNHTILDDMIHEAVMDITEEGTEAAAATSSTSNRFGTNIAFSLDQPSLLFIHDSITKVPIFWARIVTPESI
ncbi:unnamed protein product [Meganyctiphanes norvegica]|uniref:Serpin domain-containing protein n=1 Tax=Meganyctiphanes norvegica TaxID=48144 RepID=A0AAV2R4J5_MEGNR